MVCICLNTFLKFRILGIFGLILKTGTSLKKDVPQLIQVYICVYPSACCLLMPICVSDLAISFSPNDLAWPDRLGQALRRPSRAIAIEDGH